jgi:hypothetical protein
MIRRAICMGSPTHDRRSEQPRSKTAWQFSLFALLSLMTALSIYLAVWRINPQLAFAILAAALAAAALLIADYVTSRANPRSWKRMTRIAWWLVSILLIFFAALGAYLVYTAVG